MDHIFIRDFRLAEAGGEGGQAKDKGKHMADYTIDELISVCIARQISDGEVVAQGIATPLVAAGHRVEVRAVELRHVCDRTETAPLLVGAYRDGDPAVVTMRSTFRRTSSAARLGNRLLTPSA